MYKNWTNTWLKYYIIYNNEVLIIKTVFLPLRDLLKSILCDV